MHDKTYIYRSQSQVFQVGRRWYMISTDISTWIIVCSGRFYFFSRFGAAVPQTLKKSWWRRCSRQHVIIWNLICSNGFRFYPTVLKSHYERIDHLYDINIFVQIILSLIALPCTNYLTFNLLIIQNSDWSWILQNLIEEQDHFDKKTGVDKPINKMF